MSKRSADYYTITIYDFAITIIIIIIIFSHFTLSTSSNFHVFIDISIVYSIIHHNNKLSIKHHPFPITFISFHFIPLIATHQHWIVIHFHHKIQTSNHKSHTTHQTQTKELINQTQRIRQTPFTSQITHASSYSLNCSKHSWIVFYQIETKIYFVYHPQYNNVQLIYLLFHV